ncbi:ER membrane protein complex subunit 7 homolog [Diabrotica undecimpunctata]|uniref:ER membrane protein complex subunit 7 homolog n=1 Tax=Diabrotica undecimpunctata TaxID=50387 RepID=UPI003B63DCDC
MYLKLFYLFSILLVVINAAKSELNSEEDNDASRYVLEGRVFPLTDSQSKQFNWQANTRIHVNGGEYLGFVRRDGSFTVHNVPAGSYIVEVLHPEFTFEPARVEINSKGKFRARKVNHIKISEVIIVPYPLRMKALGKTRYFQLREQWRITDLLFNPMIMMMVLPLLLVMVLPKMMNDPETKKEMEQIQNMAKFEMSDMFSNYLAGSTTPQTDKDKNQAVNKKNQKTRKRIEK